MSTILSANTRMDSKTKVIFYSYNCDVVFYFPMDFLKIYHT